MGSPLLSLLTQAAPQPDTFALTFVEPRIHDFLYDGHRARILVHLGTVFDPQGSKANTCYQARLLEQLHVTAFEN